MAMLMELIGAKIFQPKNLRQTKMAEEALRFHKNQRLLILGTCFTAVSCLVTTPIFYNKNEEQLPFTGWYPFNVTRSPHHELIYLYQCTAIFFEVFINMYTEITMGAFCTFISIQCDFICDNLRSIDAKDSTAKINDFVEHHIQTVRFSKITEVVYAEICLAQFASITLALCMSLLLLSGVDSSDFEFVFLLFFQLSMFTLLLQPCWFSSETQRRSELIPEAIFGSPWVDLSKSFRNDMIFFIARTQKPIKLHAVNFFHISLDIFVQILKTSFSYYTFLSTIVE
ncbi:unnamed protein product [Callosobruchus maculatus]|uniref:Odorant receptor n=1 Tax=Callosobruchus maculatus TaxID=64391 RepID=A0A653CYQ4_CALMS|nr:unnamed protein product [Callosobruchus maculatus]